MCIRDSTHFLVIPKAHIASAAEVTAENSGVVAHIFEVIAKVARAVEYFRVELYAPYFFSFYLISSDSDFIC